MTHISKRKISDKYFRFIYRGLIQLIEKSGSNQNGNKFLKELFSPAEKVMFSKRIGMIIMIHEEVPDREIANTLSVSTSTVGRMIEKYDKGEFSYIISTLKKDKVNLEKFFNLILYGILPPKVGKERSRRLNNLISKNL